MYALSIWQSSYKNVLQFAVLIETLCVKTTTTTGILPWKFCVKGNHLQLKQFSIWKVGKIPWRRESLPTPVFWPGEFHGLYSPWGHKESDKTE